MITKVDYTPPPIAASFVSSESFYSFIEGPVGPLSAETEFLTPAGWKRIDSYAPGDKVAQWTPDPGGDETAGALEFVEPDGYIVTPAAKLLHVRNERSLSMVMSANHRVPYYDYKGAFNVTTAKEVAEHPSNRRIPTAFVPTGLPGTGLDEATLRLAVAIHADAHFPERGRTDYCVVSLRKDRKKDRLREVLSAAGVDWVERVYTGRPTETVFRFYSPYVGKSYDTAQWWGATAQELESILDEMVHWDGLYEGPDTRFTTAEKGDADFMQYAAHACGGRATISEDTYPEHARWRSTYTVHIARRGSRKAPVTTKGRVVASEVPTSDGLQYCFRTQSSFFLARHDGRVFVTGNSGKTTASLFKVIYHAVRQAPSPVDGIRRSRWVIVRNTMQQLKDTTLKSWFEWFEDGQAGRWVSSTNTFVLKFGDVHAEVLFRPLDTPDDVRRVLSLEVTGAMLDEFVEIPKEIVESLAARCGRYPSKKNGGPTWFGMWGASNPGNEDNWWHDWLDVEERGTRPRNLTFFRQPSGLSPDAENIDNLPKGREYYTNLMEGKTPEWINQFIKVQWGFSMRGKPVYKSFNNAFHVADEPLLINQHAPVFIGFDAGLTPAAVLGQQDPSGQVVILRELVSENMGAKRFCRELLKPLLNLDFRGNPVVIEADPAVRQRAQTDEKSVASVLEDELGVRVNPAWSNNLADRLGAVDDLLNRLVMGQPALLIDPSCTNLIRGFRSGYRYAVNTKGAVSPSPEKNHYSHVHDACQYFCMGMGMAEQREAKRRDVQRHLNSAGYRYF